MDIPYSLSPSLEDYLEAMYLLNESTSTVRIKDIADTLGVKMPSVIGALKVLKDRGYIRYEKSLPLTLTPDGSVIAESVHKRHRILAEFLEKTVMLSHSEADATACRIEHILSPDTAVKFENITLFLDEVREKEHISREEWKLIISGNKSGRRLVKGPVKGTE